ncbi:uncharacterized protein [Dermacentor albipictus]|uniref:uncharacterized protein n=1 Tax=Dermacentor albipictus TaxID=60249 RepID=UPI0038FCD882
MAAKPEDVLNVRDVARSRRSAAPIAMKPIQVFLFGAAHLHTYVYTYAPVNGKHYLERDIGSGKKTRSVILDTDNCKYLVQIECYPDGSVWRYVTYKASWTQSEVNAFKKRVQQTSSLSFLRCLTFKCSVGTP